MTPLDWPEAFVAHLMFFLLRSFDWKSGKAHRSGKLRKKGDESCVLRMYWIASRHLVVADYNKFGYIYIVCATGKSAPEMLCNWSPA
ncbi:unnamed protein product [Peronospora belbahrii]|uniref:Uncharacterized protein n=1 Tax=Peronospora belbahrii TaxID=622444 RepID=A0AAU9LN71_9STRA|nr:unnamed protein product [Peronospora belbahrii]